MNIVVIQQPWTDFLLIPQCVNAYSLFVGLVDNFKMIVGLNV